MTTMELVPVGKRTLDEIVVDIGQAQARMETAARGVLDEAIAIGEALIEAKDIVPRGTFKAWVAENVNMAAGNVANYMRLAEFQHLLPDHIRNPGVIETNGRIHASSGRPAGVIYPALQYIKGLGVRRTALRRVEAEEVRRLRREGLNYNQIAGFLGIAPDTARELGMTPAALAKKREDKRRARKEKQRLVILGKQHEGMKKAAPDLAAAYSHLRRCLQHAQAAHDAHHAGNAKKAMVSALGFLHKAEDALAHAEKLRNLSEPVSPS